jgi:hypothetical protein
MTDESEPEDRPDMLWQTPTGEVPMSPSQWADNIMDGNYLEGSSHVYCGLLIEYVDDEAGLWEVSHVDEEDVVDGIHTAEYETADDLLARLDEVAEEHGREHHRYAWPVITIEDGPLAIEEYPRSGSATHAKFSMHTRDARIHLGAYIEETGRVINSGFTIDPDTAEWLAEQLPEWAEKARRNEDWVFDP